MKTENGVNTRGLVLDMLLELERGGEYGNLLLKNVLDKYDYLDGRDKAFIKRLTEGVLERRIQLDYVLGQFSKTPVNKCKPLIRCLLRMGAYQILFMDNIPDSAACNEAVKLAESRHFHQLKGFVNGVLRSISRGKDTLAWPDREREAVRYFSVIYSMPEWIVRMWLADYGGKVTERMLQALLEPRPVTIRLSQRLSAQEKEALLTALEECGAHPVVHPYLDYAYTLGKTEGIASLPGFEKGQFAVQDVSSMLVTECALAGRDSTQFLLVVCAAPGGKAVHAADRLYGSGRVQARDISGYKAGLIQENARRMGLENLEVCIWDATVPDESMKEKADVVLADLPCSGLGVIGRKPDIKYRVTPESLQEVAALQRRILANAAMYVKPGGRLVYSTCTINKAENEEQAAWFASHFPFTLQSLNNGLPEACRNAETEAGMCQLLPGIHAADGFFIACFVRKE